MTFTAMRLTMAWRWRDDGLAMAWANGREVPLCSDSRASWFRYAVMAPGVFRVFSVP